MCHNGPVKHALLVLAGALLFGTTGTAQTFAPAGAESLSIGAARIAFGGLILAVVGYVARVRRQQRTNMQPVDQLSQTGGAGTRGQARPNYRKHHAISGLTWRTAIAVVAGAAVVCGYQGVFFAGTRANGVMVGTVLALGSSPLFTGVFEWVVLRSRPTRRWAVATVLAVAGLVALSWTTDLQPIDPGGVALSLTAGACYAVLAVATKWLLEHGWHPMDTAAAIMGVGSVIGFVMLATTDTSWLAQPYGIAVTAWLAIATIGAASLLMTTGMAGLSAASTTTLGLAEPATATVLGVTVLGELMTGVRALGLAAVAAGVLIAGWPRRRQ